MPGEIVKFLGEVHSAYPKKNWSSLMLLNCSRCTKLTPDYVNTATGLELHRFHWLEGDHEIGAIKGDGIIWWMCRLLRSRSRLLQCCIGPSGPLVPRTAHHGWCLGSLNGSALVTMQ